MLRFHRHLIATSLITLVWVVGLMLVYRHLAFESLIEHETRSNVALARTFANSVWPDYVAFVRSAGRFAPDEIASQPEISALDDALRTMMRGSNVLKAKIYDRRGLTVYSSEFSQIGDDKGQNPGFLGALAGRPVSNITFRDRFDAFEGLTQDRNLVASYVPIYGDGRPDRVDAVFEIYSDVTELVLRMQRAQSRVVVGVLGSVSLVYLLLIVVSRRADRISRTREEERVASEHRIHFQTYYDALTSLPNRNSFTERLEKAIGRAERQRKMLGVLSLDLDQFKLVNDSLGHDAGDDLLRILASRLRDCVRDSEMLYRTGGDEFMVVPEGFEDPERVVHLAERILRAIKVPISSNGRSLVVTGSVGIAIHPRDGSTVAKLVKNADAAMYLAKKAGRNQYRFYAPEINQRALERLELESALQQALKNEEFVLHYQPRFAADTETVLCVEALLRWRRSGERLEPPGTFIPILEQTGLIDAVGEWVLRTACRQTRTWQEEGLPSTRVSVNIAPRQFASEGFVDLVREVLAWSDLEPRYLELELTETALLDDPQGAIEEMNRLKQIGVSISIDDFGSGYSSFKYLRMLPVDYLKIDRVFVKDVLNDPKAAAIVRAIAALAGSLGVSLVAEGVEQAEQAEFLIAESCQELQGFLLSRPLEPELVSRILSGQGGRSPFKRSEGAT